MWFVAGKLNELIKTSCLDGFDNMNDDLKTKVINHDLNIVTKWFKMRMHSIAIIGADLGEYQFNILKDQFPGVEFKNTIQRLNSCSYLLAQMTCCQVWI